MNFRRRSILPMRSSFLRYQISKTLDLADGSITSDQPSAAGF
jgi:hypothetical protein